VYPKNRDGLILTGDYKGWFIMFQPISPHNNTYLILYATTPLSLGFIKGMTIGYDDWAADEENIESNLEYKNIEIQWLTQDDILQWIDEKFP
jgi:hypothetical protein